LQELAFNLLQHMILGLNLRDNLPDGIECSFAQLRILERLEQVLHEFHFFLLASLPQLIQFKRLYLFQQALSYKRAGVSHPSLDELASQ
jgi:hypothetical protein